MTPPRTPPVAELVIETLDAERDPPDAEALRAAMRRLEAMQARVERNAQQQLHDARRALVVELLPVVDDIDRAVQAASASADPGLIEGLRMVSAKLDGVLTRFGVERVDAMGHRFDPALHEALMAVPVTDPKLVGSILSQAQPGYHFGGRLLRAARVTVGVTPSSTGRR
ncbi:MAG: nucleotide exchange factor GrpE [Polyangia bacterium]